MIASGAVVEVKLSSHCLKKSVNLLVGRGRSASDMCGNVLAAADVIISFIPGKDGSQKIDGL